MGIAAGHRRTLSNISSTSSNINQGFRLDNDDIDSIYSIKNLNLHCGRNTTPDHHQYQHHHPPPSHPHSPQILNASPSASPGAFNRTRDYENLTYFQRHQQNTFYPQQQQFQQQGNEISHNHYERPISLGFEHGSQTKLRSSLKKYHTSGNSSNTNQTHTSNGAKLSSGAGTPTNPTPPDSLTSDDSSYLSAKDSSVSSQSRVRFSPETLLDLPIQGQNMDLTIPLQAQTRRMSRRHTGDLNS